MTTARYSAWLLHHKRGKLNFRIMDSQLFLFERCAHAAIGRVYQFANGEKRQASRDDFTGYDVHFDGRHVGNLFACFQIGDRDRAPRWNGYALWTGYAYAVSL